MKLLDSFLDALATGDKTLQAIHLNPWPHDRLVEMRDYLKKRFLCKEVLIIGEGDGVKTVFHAHGIMFGGKCNIDHRRRVIRQDFLSLCEKGKSGGSHPLVLKSVNDELQIYYLFKGLCRLHHTDRLPCMSYVGESITELPNNDLYTHYQKEYKKFKDLCKKKGNESKLKQYCSYVLAKSHPSYSYGYDDEKKVRFLTKSCIEYFKKVAYNFRTGGSVAKFINYFLSEYEEKMWCEIHSRSFIRRYLDID